MWRPSQDHGYTLVELLTVVVILGILAAIAYPSFAEQRRSAWRAAVANDLRTATLQMETAGASGTYPDALAQTERTVLLTSTGEPVAVSPVSPGVRLGLSRGDTDRGYCLCGYHDGLGDDAVLIYDSSAGANVDACGLDTADTCSAAPLLAAQTFHGLAFGSASPCTDAGCSLASSYSSRLLTGAPSGPLTDATLVLDGVSPTFNGSGGGWGIAFGTQNDGGFDGFVIQFERNGRLRVQGWGSDARNRWIDLDEPIDPTARADQVIARVRDGSVELEVDGVLVHTEAVDEVTGTFGVRNWHSTDLHVEEASLSVH